MTAVADPAVGILRRNIIGLVTVLDTASHLSRSCLRGLPRSFAEIFDEKLPFRFQPRFSRNATPRGRALNVGLPQHLTLKLRHRNDGFVPAAATNVDPL